MPWAKESPTIIKAIPLVIENLIPRKLSVPRTLLLGRSVNRCSGQRLTTATLAKIVVCDHSCSVTLEGKEKLK